MHPKRILYTQWINLVNVVIQHRFLYEGSVIIETYRSGLTES